MAANNQPAINSLKNTITQLENQREQALLTAVKSDIEYDGATDRIKRQIAEGNTAAAQATSVQRQQVARIDLKNALQSFVSTDRNIAQVEAQLARLTGELPDSVKDRVGNNVASQLQQVLSTNPAAFTNAYVEIVTQAAQQTANNLGQDFETIDFGDEAIKPYPKLPSNAQFVLSPAGESKIQSLEQNADQQYQLLIDRTASNVIPKYANSASPPPVAESTIAQPGTTGGSSLTRVQNPAPQPQPVTTGGASLTRVQNPAPRPPADIGGREIAIATGAAVVGSAVLNFLNNRGNVVSTSTPGLIIPQPENVGSVLASPAPLSLTESENLPGFTTDPRAAGEDIPGILEVEPEPVDSPYQDEEEDTLVDLNTGERVTAGQAQADAAIAQAAVISARNQQSVREQRRNNPDSADWRVRLRLAPNSTYLYNADDAGILEPLQASDGVIFPYTPTIQTVYKANYNSYDLTHSNYRGYFYQSSVVDDIQITGTFTAQDTVEAEYLLAVIHFFRSATKMFYGQDIIRGAPPPLVFLSALGQFQYVDAPCVIAQFNYNLPADVDYIRARSPNQDGTNLLKRRIRQNLPTNAFSAAIERLKAARLTKGGKVFQPSPPTLGLNSPTYVPTRMDVTVVLHPVQSRQQVSQQFSLKEYGSGRLQPKGYW